MGPLENQRHERFALFVAGGDVDATAYRKAFKCKQATADANATRMRDNDGIRARIAEIQRASATAKVLSMQERREFMARVVRLDMVSMDTKKDGDLVQEIITTTTKDGTTTKLKVPGKRECIMDDAKLAGELTERVEVSGTIKTTPEDVLAAVRNSPAIRGLPLTHATGNS